jgi:hypothetical protein
MPTYAAPQIFKPGDSVPLNIAGQLISHIAVFDILPSV